MTARLLEEQIKRCVELEKYIDTLEKVIWNAKYWRMAMEKGMAGAKKELLDMKRHNTLGSLIHFNVRLPVYRRAFTQWYTATRHILSFSPKRDSNSLNF